MLESTSVLLALFPFRSAEVRIGGTFGNVTNERLECFDESPMQGLGVFDLRA